MSIDEHDYYRLPENVKQQRIDEAKKRFKRYRTGNKREKERKNKEPEIPSWIVYSLLATGCLAITIFAISKIHG